MILSFLKDNLSMLRKALILILSVVEHMSEQAANLKTNHKVFLPEFCYQDDFQIGVMGLLKFLEIPVNMTDPHAKPC